MAGMLPIGWRSLARVPHLTMFARTISTLVKVVAPPSTTTLGFDGVPVVLDPVAAKFINCMMYDGEKAIARRIFENTLALIKASELEKIRASKKDQVASEEVPIVDALSIFHKAIENAKPMIGLSPLYRSGTVHQIPMPLSEKRRQSLAMKWIIKSARDRPGKPIEEKLFAEIMDAYKNEGAVIKKKMELHRMAEGNRANISIRYQ